MKCKNRQSGANLIGLMVALAVIGGVLFLVERNSQLSAKQIIRHRLVTQKAAIAQMLTKRISCESTLGGTPCIAGNYVDVLDSQGNKVLDADGTQLGLWTVRAECNSNQGITLRIARPRGTGFYKDPVTGAAHGWTSDHSFLLPQGIDFCPTRFAISPASGTSLRHDETVTLEAKHNGDFTDTYAREDGSAYYVTGKPGAVCGKITESRPGTYDLCTLAGTKLNHSASGCDVVYNASADEWKFELYGCFRGDKTGVDNSSSEDKRCTFHCFKG